MLTGALGFPSRILDLVAGSFASFGTIHQQPHARHLK
jgi:hypothetical protein